MVYMIINLFNSKISSASCLQPTFKIVAFKKRTILDTYVSVIKDGPQDGHKLADHERAGLRAGAAASSAGSAAAADSTYAKVHTLRVPTTKSLSLKRPVSESG